MTATSAQRWAFSITVALTDDEQNLINLTEEQWDALCETDEPCIGVGRYIEALGDGDDKDKMLPGLDLIKDHSETAATIYINADRAIALAQLTAAVEHYGLGQFEITGDGPAS